MQLWIFHRHTANGAYLDSAVSVLGHELAEAATDPVAIGWKVNNASKNPLDSLQYENADLCNFNPGKVEDLLRSPSGAYYNLVGNKGMQFLVQLMWDLPTQKCALQA